MVFDKASNGTVTLESAGWEGGRLLPGSGSDKVLYVVKDHLGSVRVVKDGAGNIRQRFDYYPYGTVSYAWTNSSSTDNSEKRYRFGGKEIAGSSLIDLAGYGGAPGAPYLDFGARLYSPRTATWMSPDPLMEKYYGISPYGYCAGNPIGFIDPNGQRRWPVNETYKNYTRRHENNFGAPRGSSRTHNGLDINFSGGGNTDLGAPVFATHDGVVSRVATIDSGDKNAGGNRVLITSDDGVVSTYYMHLDSIDESIIVGTIITEGQRIGTMGGSGSGRSDAYTSHLHYELRVNGELVNPVERGDLIDPQLFIAPIINGGILEGASIIAEAPILPLIEDHLQYPFPLTLLSNNGNN